MADRFYYSRELHGVIDALRERGEESWAREIELSSGTSQSQVECLGETRLTLQRLVDSGVVSKNELEKSCKDLIAYVNFFLAKWEEAVAMGKTQEFNQWIVSWSPDSKPPKNMNWRKSNRWLSMLSWILGGTYSRKS